MHYFNSSHLEVTNEVIYNIRSVERFNVGLPGIWLIIVLTLMLILVGVVLLIYFLLRKEIRESSKYSSQYGQPPPVEHQYSKDIEIVTQDKPVGIVEPSQDVEKETLSELKEKSIKKPEETNLAELIDEYNKAVKGTQEAREIFTKKWKACYISTISSGSLQEPEWKSKTRYVESNSRSSLILIHIDSNHDYILPSLETMTLTDEYTQEKILPRLFSIEKESNIEGPLYVIQPAECKKVGLQHWSINKKGQLRLKARN